MKLVTVPRPTNDQIAGREAIRNGTPWIVPESLEALDELLKPYVNAGGLRVFEWGSGGSTLYWLVKRAHVTTLERRARWYLWVQEQAKKCIINDYYELEIYLIPLSGQADDDYANAIRAYDDETFDLIFIDGEATTRNQSMKSAVPKLRKDGILLLDNSNWYDTGWLQEEWNETRWQTESYKWLGKDTVWATSILVRK